LSEVGAGFQPAPAAGLALMFRRLKTCGHFCPKWVQVFNLHKHPSCHSIITPPAPPSRRS